MRKLLLASVFALVAGAASAQVNNRAYIDQLGGQSFGGGNNATQDQTGVFNEAYITQNGTEGSTAYQLQNGYGNVARATQTNGTGNLIDQRQTGTGNKATATQDGGSGSTIRQTQAGTNHEAIAYQGGGSGNTTTQTQSGNSGAGHYANSRMVDQVNSTQTINQDSAGARNFAYQNMMSAGSGNIQSITQTSGGNTANQIVR
jgi:hypothetical protein